MKTQRYFLRINLPDACLTDTHQAGGFAGTILVATRGQGLFFIFYSKFYNKRKMFSNFSPNTGLYPDCP